MKKLTRTLAALCALAMAVNAYAQGHNWKFVATGDGTTHAIDKDGSLWAWGWNDEGQLGYELPMKPDGSARYDRTAVPQQVGTATDWVSASSGQSRVFAIKSDGTLWAAGMNSKGARFVLFSSLQQNIFIDFSFKYFSIKLQNFSSVGMYIQDL